MIRSLVKNGSYIETRKQYCLQSSTPTNTRQFNLIQSNKCCFELTRNGIFIALHCVALRFGFIYGVYSTLLYSPQSLFFWFYSLVVMFSSLHIYFCYLVSVSILFYIIADYFYFRSFTPIQVVRLEIMSLSFICLFVSPSVCPSAASFMMILCCAVLCCAVLHSVNLMKIISSSDLTSYNILSCTASHLITLLTTYLYLY